MFWLPGSSGRLSDQTFPGVLFVKLLANVILQLTRNDLQFLSSMFALVLSFHCEYGPVCLTPAQSLCLTPESQLLRPLCVLPLHPVLPGVHPVHELERVSGFAGWGHGAAGQTGRHHCGGTLPTLQTIRNQ